MACCWRLRIGLVAAVALLLCVSVRAAEDAFDRWEAQLPDDYAVSTRDWARMHAGQLRAILEAGQPVSDRTLRLYGRPYPGLTWVEDASGGHLALDTAVAPADVHVTPKGFAGTLVNGIGPLLHDPNADLSILGVDREQLRAIARDVAALQTQQPHQDFDFGGAIAGFGRGKGLYYFWQHYLTLALLGDVLTDDQRKWYEEPLLEGVMGHQMAPRPTERVVVAPWGIAGNTMMEENMWGLDNRIAQGLYAREARGPDWEETWAQLCRDLVNACSTLHLQACTEVVEGRPVNEWATGSAWWADYTITNHTSPDVMYSQNAINTSCLGAACFLHEWGRIPRVHMYNFDWVARRFLLPLTLWRGRIYSPNERERTRYGEAAPYFQAIRLGTYLKLRHRNALAARLERDCLAFAEWSEKIQPGQAYVANVLAQVEVEPAPDEALQRWLSGNAWFWAHATYNGIAVNRTPWRLAVMGAENGVSDWGVIPREGDWLFSAWGRLGSDAFVQRRTWFYGGGLAALGRKPDGSRHLLAALPDERTVVLLSRAAPDAGDEAGAQVTASLELLSSNLNEFTHRLSSAEGERVLSPEVDATSAEARPIAGPWLNVDDRIGYIIVDPAEASFAHGLHATDGREEHRIPLSWPGRPDATEACTVIICDQEADETRRVAEGGAFQRIDGPDDLTIVSVEGRDGSRYAVVMNWGDDVREVVLSLAGIDGVASVLGRSSLAEGGGLHLRTRPGRPVIAQVADATRSRALEPQVRLTAPRLDDVVVDAQTVRLRAEASATDGVREVRFMARQGGIFAEPKVLGTAVQAPWVFTWRPGPADRGRYAEVWAEAVTEAGVSRASSSALVMVRAE